MTITLQTINNASMTELKAFAHSNDIQIDGDRRLKSTWFDAVEAWFIEGGAMEEVANQADINNGTAIVTTFTQDEPFTCAYPTQQVSDFINLVEYANSPTQEAIEQPTEDEMVNVLSETTPALERNLSSGSSVMFLLTPIAMLVAGMLISGMWVVTSFSTLLIALVKYLLPRIDNLVTRVLLGTVAVVDYLFGEDSIEDMNPELIEIQHLI